MLRYKPLRSLEGIVIISDYLSLRCLYDITFDINEKSGVVRNKEGLLPGVAHMIRHAYEGRSVVEKPSEIYPEIGVRYGFKIGWPALLVYARMMRVSLAFMDHSKRHQAIVYELENLVEQAVRAQFKDGADEVLARWSHIDPAHPFVEDNAETRDELYAQWSSKERKKGLAGLLMSLDPMYPAIYRLWADRGFSVVPPETFENIRRSL